MSRRLTVLHFSNTEVRGGAEEHMLSLLDGLDRRYFRRVPRLLAFQGRETCSQRLQKRQTVICSLMLGGQNGNLG
jgi:hypothetical protein